MKITPLTGPGFGATVANFDCAVLETGAIDAIRACLYQHQLLVFRQQQHLSPVQEVAFYRAIDTHGAGVWRDQTNNPWEVYKVRQGNLAGTYQLPEEPSVLVLGKGRIDHYGLQVTLGGARGAYGKDSGSQVLGGGALQWHIDGTFYEHPPCNYTQMRCIEAPRGEGHWLSYDDDSGDRLWCAAGSTAFASGRLAFDLLCGDDRQRCLNSRVHYASNPFQASYAFANSNDGLRLVDPAAEVEFRLGRDSPGCAVDDPLAQTYPLVWTCAVSGKQALMPQPRCMQALEQQTARGSHFLGVVESRHRIADLMRAAIKPENVYVHAWQPGDLVIWHNRSMWHSATGKLAAEDRRIMHLTAFNGTEAPLCASE